jgi:hypothetical protein
MAADDLYARDPSDDHLRLSKPRGLEEAWRRAQAELPPGATIAGVSRGRRPAGWTAQATGPKGYGLSGYGHDPESAILDLVDRIKFERPAG